MTATPGAPTPHPAPAPGPAADATAGRPPRVSVIVPAYNAMPELTRCITSATEQTLGLDRIEIIAVDDGSTDGTGAELDRLAAGCPALRVVHQANSGGAGGPRNTGLDLARGDFVFFLDSDDYLGPDALRRMVAMADDNGTDIVLGRMVSVGGRAVPTAVFRHNQPRTDIFSSAAYRTLGPWKMFRRSLVERLRLRFPPYRNCEDKPFTAAAYLNADGISVVADYDCYYVRNRENGNNLTLVAADLAHRMDGSRLCFETVARYLEPGPRRDQIMRRHVEWELCGPLRALLPRESEQDARDRFYPEFRYWARTWATDGVRRQLEARDRLLIHLLRADRFEDLMTVVRNAREDERRGRLVDKGRVYWLHPFFRDPAAGIPDDCFDVTDRVPVHHGFGTARWHRDGVLRVTGHGYLEHVATVDPGTEMILRLRDADRPDIRVRTTPGPAPGDLRDGDHADAGFTVDLDLRTADGGAPPEAGIWDLFLDVRAQGVSRTVRFRQAATGPDGKRTPPPPAALDPGPDTRPTTVTPFFTPYGNFSLRVGGPPPAPPAAPCRVTGVRWDREARGTLVVAGRLTGPARPRPADGTPEDGGNLLLRAVEDGSGATHEVPVRPAPDGPAAFTARLPLPALRPGRWTVTLALPGADGSCRGAPVPRPDGLPGTRWFRLGRPYCARPLTRGRPGTLVFEVAPIDLVKGVRRRWARVRRAAAG
ncbi:glycosyltransferase family 2 protein [Streptomyces sp. NPDC018031]|uniref:glycosyltransferase family 2 protein n=1 Tax=Streptomyces sp. NPDC018031 TaxID=3365033 RepID=UPI00379E83C8